MINASRLGIRLPATTIGLALLSGAAMGGFSWSSARSGLIEAAGARLELAAAARRDGIELVADRMQADFLAAAGHPQVVSNFPDLIETLDPAKPDFTAIVEAFRAPATVEARIALDSTPATAMYGRRHAKVQEVARRLLAEPGYADLIFLDEGGRVVYTTTKGEDFAKSLDEPALKETGLARLVERLKGQDPAATVFEDFAAYPVGTGPLAFIGRAMTKRANVAMGTAQAAERIGFVVLRVTPALFDRTLAKRAGLGETGQILATGADGRLRSNPPLNPAVKAGAPVTDLGFGAARLVGGSFAYPGTDGTHMAASATVSVLGAPWTVVAEQAEAEATGAVQTLSRTLALIALAVLVGTALLGLLLARSIVQPLGALTRALKALAARETLAEVPGSRRQDEIGDIARAVVTIRDMTLEEAAQQLKTTEAARGRGSPHPPARPRRPVRALRGWHRRRRGGRCRRLAELGGQDAGRGGRNGAALDQRCRRGASNGRQRQCRGGSCRGAGRDCSGDRPPSGASGRDVSLCRTGGVAHGADDGGSRPGCDAHRGCGRSGLDHRGSDQPLSSQCHNRGSAGG